MRSLSTRAQLRHRLLGGQQRIVRGGEQATALRQSSSARALLGERGRHLRHRVAIASGKGPLSRSELRRLRFECGPQLGEPHVDDLEPALGTDDGLARRLPRSSSLARRLLRLPVALLGRGDRPLAGLLRLAERG